MNFYATLHVANAPNCEAAHSLIPRTQQTNTLQQYYFYNSCCWDQTKKKTRGFLNGFNTHWVSWMKIFKYFFRFFLGTRTTNEYLKDHCMIINWVVSLNLRKEKLCLKKALVLWWLCKPQNDHYICYYSLYVNVLFKFWV